MAIQVKDMLNLFDDFEVIAGHAGLSRFVTTVSVMDAPDIYEWIHGGEFLITTAYVYKDNPCDLKNLIRKIEQAGASALGIKLGRFIDKIPDDSLKLAEDLKFPLIYLPHRYAFTDIINPVLSRIVNEQNRLLLLSENIHKSLAKLVIDGGDAQQIVNILAQLINQEIAYYNTIFNFCYSSAGHTFSSELNDTQLDELLGHYYNYQLQVNRKVFGYIIIDINKNEVQRDLVHIAVEHAATVLTLDYQKRIMTMQIESRYRDLFVQDLILNNIRSKEEIDNRAALFKWKFDTGLIAVLVDIDNFKLKTAKASNIDEQHYLEDRKESIFNTARQMFHDYFPGSVFTSFSDVLVYLVKLNENKLEREMERLGRLCDTLREKTSDTGFTVTIGIGNYCTSVVDVHNSYKEAQKVIKLVRLQSKGDTTVFYSAMGTYRLLAHICGTEDSDEFCHHYLGNIIEYDSRHNGELLLTLHSIVKNDWNLKLAANELYIHYNTIKYRYRKILSLLAIESIDVETKLNVALALKLLNMGE